LGDSVSQPGWVRRAPDVPYARLSAKIAILANAPAPAQPAGAL